MKGSKSRPHLPQTNLVAALETLRRRSEYSTEGVSYSIELYAPESKQTMTTRTP
jgi:hypothetical protein